MAVVNCTEFCLLILQQIANATVQYHGNGVTADSNSLAYSETDDLKRACSGKECSFWLKYAQETSPDGLHLSLDAEQLSTQRPRNSGSVPEAPVYILAIVSILYCIIFLVGMAGNFLVILVVCRTSDMRNTTNFFLVNLSVADLLVILVCMPSAFLDIFSKEVWYLGAVMCK